MGLRDFINRIFKHDTDDTKNTSDFIEDEKPVSDLIITNFLECVALEYLFPLSFSVGNVPIRVCPSKLKSSSNAFETSFLGLWFYWKAETKVGKLLVYWNLSLPSPTGNNAIDDNAKKTITAVAFAATVHIKNLLSSIPALIPSSFLSGPCPCPSLEQKKIFCFDFTYSARGTFREGRAYSSIQYPLLVSKLLGVDISKFKDDPIRAICAASNNMCDKNLQSIWFSRAFKYVYGKKEKYYLPVYELFNILPDKDLRLIIQNNIIPKAHSYTLGALFMYRTMLTTKGHEREYIIHPESFNHQRVDPLFPLAILENGNLNSKNAATDIISFFSNNDIVYENLFKATKNSSLQLQQVTIHLLQDIYVKMVFETKRKKLFDYITTGKPMIDILKQEESILHRCVDICSDKILAAAIYGSKDYFNIIQKYCSKKKCEEILNEIEKISEELKTGTLNIDALLKDRLMILEKLKIIIENKKRE